MTTDRQIDRTLEREIDDLVATGRFESRLDVLRAGVRLVREREVLADLEAKIRVGIAEADAGRKQPLEDVRAELMIQEGTASP